MKSLSENIFEQFSPNVLNPKEMSEVIGGIRPKPKTRDKDYFDDDTQ